MKIKVPNMKTRLLLSVVAAALLLSPSRSNSSTRAQLTAPPTEKDFRVYEAKGKLSSLEEIVAAMGAADAVLIGEGHDDPTAHTLETELLRLAFERHAAASARPARPVVLSLEMFERDVQTVLDEYLAGLISERHFLLSSRPWKNYETDYRPLVEFARRNKLPVVAANAPARYVSRVAQAGPDSLTALSKDARAWLPPLPLAPASKAYEAKFALFMRGDAPHGSTAQRPSAHGASFLLDAQNLRDASMGQTIAEQLKRRPGALVLHVTGRFHIEERLGVTEHLLRFRPKTRVLIVTILSPANFPDFEPSESGTLGDFIILTNPNPLRSN